MSQLLQSSVAGLAALRDTLLIQSGPEEAARLVGMLRPGAGLVITGDRGTDIARSLGGRAAVLTDRGRYSGAGRQFASSALDAGWISSQRQAGVVSPLTDSGYVAANDIAGLRAILSSAAQLGPDVVATLPLARRWLTHDSAVLVDEVNAYNVPVALVLESPDDPFSVRGAVHGLVHFLDGALVPSVLLRSDISAVGALAFGALSAAVGVRSGLRHLYELPKHGKGGRRPAATESAFWRPGMYMVTVERLALAVARTRMDPQWLCSCRTCGGRTVDWMYRSASHDEILSHNLELLLDERDKLVRTPVGGLRRQSWRAMCGSAEFVFTHTAATSAAWTVPPAIRWWQTV